MVHVSDIKVPFDAFEVDIPQEGKMLRFPTDPSSCNHCTFQATGNHTCHGADRACNGFCYDVRDFEYATLEDLDNPHTFCLVGKRVVIEDYTVNVLRSLGSGRTGSAFCVQVVEPESQAGTLLALKYRIGAEGIESLTREAKFMASKVVGVAIPHAVTMKGFGSLKVPLKLWGISMLPQAGVIGRGILLTLARGSRLANANLTKREICILRSQLDEFAEAMYNKHLIHADLTSENIFWNRGTCEATVIDFGNSIDVNSVESTLQQMAALAKLKNARQEMIRFWDTSDFLGRRFSK